MLRKSGLPLKVFGCTVFVHILGHFLSNFDPRAEKCVFVGYAPTKRDTSVIIPKPENSILVWMLLF